MKKETAKEIRTYTIYKIETDVKEITGYADGIWIPCYIGVTSRLVSERMHEHRKKGSSVAPYIKKYGKEHFRIIAMFTVNTSWNIAQKYEESQTKIAQSIYKLLNKSFGAKHCDKTKKKLSIKHIGKKMSEETKRKISQAEKGHRSWNKGLKHSAESKEKISKALKKAYAENRKNKDGLKGLKNPRCRKIYCLTNNTYYNYIKEAADKLNISAASIYVHLNRNSKGLVAGKYKFKYVKEDE
jgi:hypothetical protein